MTEKQKYNSKTMKWLDEHGGRTYADLFVDENGEYVLMADGEGGKYNETKRKIGGFTT
jgi:hypothetical protein